MSMGCVYEVEEDTTLQDSFNEKIFGKGVSRSRTNTHPELLWMQRRVESIERDLDNAEKKGGEILKLRQEELGRVALSVLTGNYVSRHSADYVILSKMMNHIIFLNDRERKLSSKAKKGASQGSSQEDEGPSKEQVARNLIKLLKDILHMTPGRTEGQYDDAFMRGVIQRGRVFGPAMTKFWKCSNLAADPEWLFSYKTATTSACFALLYNIYGIIPIFDLFLC